MREPRPETPESATEPAILVVGSVALDSVKTPYGEVDEALGGSASYFAVSASHFAPVRMIAVVGEDFPERHRELFASRGIDVSGIETASGRTFRWRGEYMAELGHAHTLETQLNVFSTFHPRLHDHHRRSRFVFLANIDPDLQLEVLRQTRGARLTVSDTMNYWIARKPDKVLDVLREVDLALCNEEEARALSGETHLTRAAERLLEQGARAVIIKKGEHGAWLVSRQDRFMTPAFPLGALNDPTGAGDSFAGGFLGWIARAGRLDPETVRQAVVCGTVMASIAIEGFSPARLASTSLGEVAERMAVLHRLVYFGLDPNVLSERGPAPITPDAPRA